MRRDQTVRALGLALLIGAALLIDEGRISVELEAKSGKIARLRVRSPRHVTVERKRLHEDEETRHE